MKLLTLTLALTLPLFSGPAFAADSSYLDGAAAAAQGKVLHVKKHESEAPALRTKPAGDQASAWQDPPRRIHVAGGAEPLNQPDTSASEAAPMSQWQLLLNGDKSLEQDYLKKANLGFLSECRNSKVAYADLSAKCKNALDADALHGVTLSEDDANSIIKKVLRAKRAAIAADEAAENDPNRIINKVRRAQRQAVEDARVISSHAAGAKAQPEGTDPAAAPGSTLDFNRDAQ